MKPMRSITEQVYVMLRSDLINCRLKPGAKLRTNELSRRFGVSLSAVREALARLSADGLAVADPQRGFTAAPISAADLSGLSEAAMGIETLCIQRALVVGDAAWESRLTAAFRELAAIPISNGAQHLSTDYAAAYSAFENALIAACDNPWLLRLRTTLSAQTERYKLICLPAAPVEPDPTQMAQDMLNAAVMRDVALTIALVAKARRINTARFIKVLENTTDEIQFLAGASATISA